MSTSRKNSSRFTWTADHDAALRRLAEAVQQVRHADTPITQQQLRAAVDSARDAGLGWTQIGDALGIASGNAYHRYRRRPIASEQEQPCDAGETSF
ncbi:hypothetical protein TUM20985_48700 [Mycobacterium antarcticum]|uniref:hypothetical protein n=1 Tax=unclassified Mycolicibacterium TaxID=2636767 RepID=UPI0023A0FB6D|nr:MULTISPECIES: hypothetical protein [unclassified Mycolicibacterium]BDX34323.1 hypothetical protein TUM20985_48700 [Mycolicibacterium sp. TUM20985]GLP77532.1 hypothetical protein TUM20983_46420 [Mycolicibacterium sp. TUM20983]GLP82071.1 hypothetical protein TUM20984_34910 [Mycolicibacterium sp. TUM20984]